MKMDIGVEISLYPLTADFIPPIEDFIGRIQREGGLRVVTNSMSTQVFGPYDLVMGRLVRELRGTFENSGKAVFVIKVLGPLAEP
jgi:uncharacterized protein YqgV (UPF0045/DUF77 family)